MTEDQRHLKGLVLVSALLRARGTDVEKLEREIERLRSLKRAAELPAAA
jgi:hypothetical protein